MRFRCRPGWFSIGFGQWSFLVTPMLLVHLWNAWRGRYPHIGLRVFDFGPLRILNRFPPEGLGR